MRVAKEFLMDVLKNFENDHSISFVQVALEQANNRMLVTMMEDNKV